MTEKEVMLKIWAERPHVSEISGEPLIENIKHKLFWNQFMHCVPKSIYKRFRTREDNIFLGTVDEHITQTRRVWLTTNDPRWNKFWERYDELKREYHSGKT